jgi:ubiquinone/menaquinone biosynthesis C-methylase UbiE
MQTPLPQNRQLLERAIAFLRPAQSTHPPEVISDGTGLRCPTTGRVFTYRNAVLDLLDEPPEKTMTQRAVDTNLSALAYDFLRTLLTRLVGLPRFTTEVAAIQEKLSVRAGDTVLDLACGPGNFTTEWARRAGSDGLVFGLDLSEPMLKRAAVNIRRAGLDNVLLIRGDAHSLPFVDRCLLKVNCSGGFHQFPDLPRALREIARVSSTDAVLTASTFAERPQDPHARFKRWAHRRFALHFVPLAQLGRQLETLGYADYTWSLPGGWFGYASARKSGTSNHPPQSGVAP